MRENTNWIALVAMLSRVDPEELDAVKQWLRGELQHRRLHYRYYVWEHDDGLLHDGQLQHTDDLPELFWRLAAIDWTWSSATFEGKTIVRIEVSVPDTESPASAGTVPIAPESKGSRRKSVRRKSPERAVAEKVLGRLFPPDGRPPDELRSADILRKVQADYAREPVKSPSAHGVPSDDTILRTAGRRPD